MSNNQILRKGNLFISAKDSFDRFHAEVAGFVCVQCFCNKYDCKELSVGVCETCEHSCMDEVTCQCAGCHQIVVDFGMRELKRVIHETNKLKLVRKMAIHEAAKIGRDRVTMAEKEIAFHASVRQIVEETRKIREQWRMVGFQAARSAVLRDIRRITYSRVFSEAAGKAVWRAASLEIDEKHRAYMNQKRSVSLVFAVVVALLALVVAIIQA
jgi:hypothetical protein